MLLGLYGGTFDPIHHGHIHVARSVRELLEFSEIRMVLSARPGHRADPAGSIRHRWRMLELACEFEGGLIPDDTEIRDPRISYTFDTASALGGEDRHPCWILGLDSYVTLPSWHRWDELLSVCNLIVVDRPGHRAEVPPAVISLERMSRVQALEDRVGQILYLDLPMLNVSSTEVRARLAVGQDAKHLIAHRVYTYIKQNRLYSEKAI